MDAKDPSGTLAGHSLITRALFSPLLEMADDLKMLYTFEKPSFIQADDLLCVLFPPFPFLSHSDKSDKTIWKTVQSFPSLDWQTLPTPSLEKSTIRNSYNIYFHWVISKSSVPCFKIFIIIPTAKSNRIKCLNDYRLSALTAVVITYSSSK